MTKKKILVTGGAGFIGSNFCNRLKETYQIVALDNLFLGNPENLDSEICFIEGDARNQTDLQKCGSDFDVVLHLAGTSSAPMFEGEGLLSGYLNSVESFIRALEFTREIGGKKFLYASTSSLYGNNPPPLLESQNVVPPNHYAVTKLMYEYCGACYNQVYKDLDIIGFRFMSVYGPHEESKGRYANMISQFLWDIARDKAPIIYGDGSQSRDFTHVFDIVEALRLTIENPKIKGSRVYNIGRGETTSFNSIFETINDKLGKSIKPEYIENPIKETYVQTQCADISLIKKDLGYNPKVLLEEGINHLVKYLDIQNIKETSSDLMNTKKL